MKTCEEYAALLDMYVDGFCTDEEAERVRKHLTVCEDCRMYVEQILQMKEAFPDAEEEEVPAGFAEGVMAAVRAEAMPRKKRMKSWQRTLLQMAACMAIVIALGPLSARLTGGMDAKDAVMEMSMAGTASKAQAPTEPAVPMAPAVWDAKAEAAIADAPAAEPENASPVEDAAEKPMEQKTGCGSVKVKLSRSQIAELLSGYSGAEQEDRIVYELTAAEMDAVLAKIPAGNVIPGGTADADMGFCLLIVYPTE